MGLLMSRIQIDQSIVLFSSDHDCHFCTRNDEYKRSCHDVSVRIPMVIYGGPFLGGGRDQRLIQLTDLVPTLCDAEGVDLRHSTHGRSALSKMHDEAFI